MKRKPKIFEMSRKLRLVFCGKDLVVYSLWTGEVCNPWEFRKIIGMIRDFRLTDDECFYMLDGFES